MAKLNAAKTVGARSTSTTSLLTPTPSTPLLNYETCILPVHVYLQILRGCNPLCSSHTTRQLVEVACEEGRSAVLLFYLLVLADCNTCSLWLDLSTALGILDATCAVRTCSPMHACKRTVSIQTTPDASFTSKAIHIHHSPLFLLSRTGFVER